MGSRLIVSAETIVSEEERSPDYDAHKCITDNFHSTAKGKQELIQSCAFPSYAVEGVYKRQ